MNATLPQTAKLLEELKVNGRLTEEGWRWIDERMREKLCEVATAATMRRGSIFKVSRKDRRLPMNQDSRP
jgi:hypothetical protein